ncbi:MAG: hypothetical protein IJ849_10805 [Selenomonadaceae bacterium]|nr:hypothetical protein [Selenomonadaceae bacterium]
MKIITVSDILLKRFRQIDAEMLQDDGRPCLLLISMKYKGIKHDFAVPLRSNIPAATPKNQYFPLPNRRTTRDNRHHGLHFAKMFPVAKKIFTGIQD